MTNHLFMERQQDIDITKHLESLKTRLRFARFKLRNGWENNTLLDVESFWKERQRHIVDSLPTPRFTQRHILDNRTLHPHYHYHTLTTDTRIQQQNKNEKQHQRRYSHHAQEKTKKRTKLIRSHSTPITSTSQTQSINRSDFPSTFSTHHDSNSDDDDDTYSMNGKRKRLMTHTPPSPPVDNDMTTFSTSRNNASGYSIQSRKSRSSLDCLYFAISMKEKDQHDQHDMENSPSQQDSESGTDHQDSDDSDQYSSLVSQPSKLFKTPPSPVTAAAETMMMFGQHHTQII